jgi:cytosine/adenosine deaminase-related metal-dependent hydrolase
MDYRKFKADYLFTGYQMLNADHVLIAGTDGKIIDIIPAADAGEDIEVFQGILSPGFINCHCHLELSHLKGLIPEKKGLVDFVYTVVTQRHIGEEEIQDAISRGEDEMITNGIVAVGDICNNTSTIPQKQKHRLIYYNFIEVSGWLPQIAETRFARSKFFYDEYSHTLADRDHLSMSPHAPYSVSNELWELINPYFKNKTATIHNQETVFEDELFRKGTGDFLRMYKLMNIDNSFFQPPGKSSLQSYFRKLKNAKKMILVHNTFSQEEDVKFATGHQGLSSAIYFCLCSNANQYIEEALPPVELFRKHNCNLVLGTDSLASNHGLSILEEMKTISQHFPNIPFTEILQWATINGAKALEIDSIAGSFSPGKVPGIILIENIDGQTIGQKASIKRIL